jgi:hypothetical protein
VLKDIKGAFVFSWRTMIYRRRDHGKPARDELSLAGKYDEN